MNHAADRRRVRQLDRVVNAAQSHSLDHGRLLLVESDRTFHERHLDALRVGLFRCFFRHIPSFSVAGPLASRHSATYLIADISSRSLPRNLATAAGDLRHSRPLNVARTTLCGFAEPSDLVSTL